VYAVADLAVLEHLAERLLVDGEHLRRDHVRLSEYLETLAIGRTAGFNLRKGISAPDDAVRALTIGESRSEAAIAFGPSAGLVLAASLEG